MSLSVWPVVVRELRAEARRPSAYWVRTIAAGLLTALFVWSVWNFAGDDVSLGSLLFLTLTQGFHLGAMVIVAALTADCISREKREGTLGLLFLTPLTARDIVIGKTVSQVLRAAPVLLATLPVISLPFLLGGISTGQAVAFFCQIPIDLGIAIAAGMIASVRNTEWVQSIVWAELLCAAFVALTVAAVVALFFVQVNLPIGAKLLTRPVRFGLEVVVQYVFPAAFLPLALRYASRRLKGAWQADAGEKPEPVWVRFFSKSGFWRAAFRWDTRKARDRNPIAWLQEYNWTSRLTKWGWCLLLFLAQMRMLLNFRGYVSYQMQLYILTAMGIAFSAAASFRRERQTGALELLLVTPISASQLVWGRLQGVWIHFLPAIAILACVWVMGPQWISLPYRYTCYLAGAYFCIPVIGFYAAVLTSNVFVAWLLTMFCGLLLPYGITEAFRWDIGRTNLPFVFLCIQIVTAAVAAYLLRRNLVRRTFVLQ